MTPRHIILGIATLAVLGMALYLFNEVRTTTASSAVPQRTPPPPTAAADNEPKPSESEPSKVASRPANLPVRASEPPPTPSQPPVSSTGGGDTPPPALESVADELAKPNPRMDAVMAEANKAYDRGEFDEAKTTALKVLAKDPANVRMLRIVVSANCIDGDSAEAQKHYLSLPPGDREQMKVRCARYGVSFNDK